MIPIKVATASVNQTPLDWYGNQRRIEAVGSNYRQPADSGHLAGNLLADVLGGLVVEEDRGAENLGHAFQPAGQIDDRSEDGDLRAELGEAQDVGARHPAVGDVADDGDLAAAQIAQPLAHGHDVQQTLGGAVAVARIFHGQPGHYCFHPDRDLLSLGHRVADVFPGTYQRKR